MAAVEVSFPRLMIFLACLLLMLDVAMLLVEEVAWDEKMSPGNPGRLDWKSFLEGDRCAMYINLDKYDK